VSQLGRGGVGGGGVEPGSAGREVITLLLGQEQHAIHGPVVALGGPMPVVHCKCWVMQQALCHSGSSRAYWAPQLMPQCCGSYQHLAKHDMPAAVLLLLQTSLGPTTVSSNSM